MYYGSKTQDKMKTVESVISTVPPSEQRRKSDNALMFTFGGGNIVTDSGAERIIYTTRRKGQRALANWCWHNRVRTKYGGITSTKNVVTQLPPGLYYYNLYQQHNLSASAHTTALTTFKTDSGALLRETYLNTSGQALINLGLSELKPDFTEVSLPNFLIDIGQLRDLYKLWKKKQGIAKNVAGAHLNYKFGWKPTHGDLTGMWRGILELRHKLSEFEKNLGVISHRQKVLFKNTFNKSATFTTGDPNYQCDYSGTLSQKASAHIVYKPLPLSQVCLGPIDAMLRGSLDTLGIELNPRIAWDAIPFSFVIDWFFDVGRWLEQYRVDALELPIVLVDSYVQYKESLIVSSIWCEGRTVQSVQGPISRSGGWFTEERFFHRVPIRPDYSVLTGLGWKLPTTNQTLLLLSLEEVNLGLFNKGLTAFAKKYGGGILRKTLL
jgi:hypothetical protein